MNTLYKARLVFPTILLTGSLAGQATAEQDWQERKLFAPSATQQRLERQGRVYIYDGLHEDTVDRALDAGFDRVENMMFIGVRRSTADGLEYADDDC